MKARRFDILILGGFLAALCGCGLPGKKSSSVSMVTSAAAPVSSSDFKDQERRFAGALELLRAGREQEARDLLERVLEGPQRSGVTDEALFRLSLLYLRDEGSRGALRAIDLIDLLQSDYPGSIWARQAAPLSVYLTGVRNLRDRQREVKTLKELNLSLSRDNRELRQSIERLKSLDLELDKKIKR